MGEEIPIITTEQYTAHATKWLQAIKRGECVSVLFFPKTDRYIRTGQLLNDKALLHEVLGNSYRYIFQRLEFDAHDAEDIDDLLHQLTEQLNFSRITDQSLSFQEWMRYLEKHNIRLVYVIVDAEKFLKPETKQVLSLLTQVVLQYSKNIQILSMYETDITHSSYASLLPSSTVLYDNVFRYPLYNKEQTQAFIKLLSDQWNVSLSKTETNKLIQGCGGHFWLVKEAMREVVAEGSWSSKRDGMLFRLRMLYEIMLPSEQRVIEKIATFKNSLTREERQSLRYLQKMNVVDTDEQCLLQVLNDYVVYRDRENDKLCVQNNRVMLVFVNDIHLL